MSIYHDEYGIEKPVTPFTEFAGGILDSYYLRIREADQEVEHLTSRNRNLETENESLRAEVNRRADQEKALTKDRDAWKIKAQRLQGTIDTHATEIAKRDKVIEQYAAWRVAVREAIKDAPPGLPEDLNNAALVSVDLLNIVIRIDELTKEVEGS